ncbi:right-handed parallel beta-helix repeat-containing protein [Polycladomyces subterraneus]|uniref:Right-handed parallel beta-helix repeat-containing protein n=1 Tax=Polycladomyces subterraneus TaxID=1016997 RepID=A0ABT8IM59_9BACL|nr:right-handed parallel beta-helix repeat-containing protein [Polycladomyces subterraneus]
MGYATVFSVQQTLNDVINNLVDPNNIYVRAGAVGGNGSLAKPFGTIPQGIAAVNLGGAVNILSGTYPITSQIAVNKSGITLKGESGTVLLLQANPNLIPLMILANNTTIDGLTITSDIPYPREFIQVGGANTTLINNTIYGLPQAPPMINWVVNRAVVPQESNTNLTVENNTFYSLRTGIYINPNVTGAINNNVVYNTKGGFLVDRAFTTFVGNSWGTPAYEFDIVLLAGTTMGTPYNDLPALSAAINDASISDQR